MTMEELQDRIEQLQGASSTGKHTEPVPTREEEAARQKKI